MNTSLIWATGLILIFGCLFFLVYVIKQIMKPGQTFIKLDKELIALGFVPIEKTDQDIGPGTFFPTEHMPIRKTLYYKDNLIFSWFHASDRSLYISGHDSDFWVGGGSPLMASGKPEPLVFSVHLGTSQQDWLAFLPDKYFLRSPTNLTPVDAATWSGIKRYVMLSSNHHISPVLDTPALHDWLNKLLQYTKKPAVFLKGEYLSFVIPGYSAPDENLFGHGGLGRSEIETILGDLQEGARLFLAN